MSLDFSALDNISNEFNKCSLNNDDNENKPLISKTVLNDDILQQRYLKIEQYNEEVYSRAFQVYIMYQENTKRSEKLRIEINRAVKADEPIEEILDICLKCISLMTNDEAFYRRNIKYLFQK